MDVANQLEEPHENLKQDDFHQLFRGIAQSRDSIGIREFEKLIADGTISDPEEVLQKFGSVQTACSEARKILQHERAIIGYLELSRKVGYLPTFNEIRNNGWEVPQFLVTKQFMNDLFGLRAEASRRMALSEVEEGDLLQWKMAVALAKISKEEFPTHGVIKERSEKGLCESPEKYCEIFGSLPRARVLCGICSHHISEHELIKDLQDLAKSFPTLSYRVLLKHGQALGRCNSYSMYNKFYNASVKKALSAAGLVLTNNRWEVCSHSDEDRSAVQTISEDLRKLHQRLGRFITISDILDAHAQGHICSLDEILRLFRTISNARWTVGVATATPSTDDKYLEALVDLWDWRRRNGVPITNEKRFHSDGSGEIPGSGYRLNHFHNLIEAEILVSNYGQEIFEHIKNPLKHAVEALLQAEVKANKLLSREELLQMIDKGIAHPASYFLFRRSFDGDRNRIVTSYLLDAAKECCSARNFNKPLPSLLESSFDLYFSISGKEDGYDVDMTERLLELALQSPRRFAKYCPTAIPRSEPLALLDEHLSIQNWNPSDWSIVEGREMLLSAVKEKGKVVDWNYCTTIEIRHCSGFFFELTREFVDRQCVDRVYLCFNHLKLFDTENRLETIHRLMAARRIKIPTPKIWTEKSRIRGKKLD